MTSVKGKDGAAGNDDDFEEHQDSIGDLARMKQGSTNEHV